MLRAYYYLTKPGIIYGNLLSATAGFLFASKFHIYAGLLAATLSGTALVIASACVFNNYIDRGIDSKMSRTKQRALVQHTIPAANALAMATVLGASGFAVLVAWTNWLVVLIGATAFVDYVILYGLTKRRSVQGTIVGSISGAAPIVAGYCAVRGRFDVGALLLFLILVAWQVPHFYAIAMYRFNDYKHAGLPVLPVKQGMRITKIQILLYVIAFLVAVSAVTLLGYSGYTFLTIMAAVALVWLWFGVQGFRAKNDEAWARKMFFISLMVLLSLSVMLPIGTLLP